MVELESELVARSWGHHCGGPADDILAFWYCLAVAPALGARQTTVPLAQSIMRLEGRQAFHCRPFFFSSFFLFTRWPLDTIRPHCSPPLAPLSPEHKNEGTPFILTARSLLTDLEARLPPHTHPPPLPNRLNDSNARTKVRLRSRRLFMSDSFLAFRAAGMHRSAPSAET